MKIILHNSEAKESRELVAAIGDDPEVVIIDWYKDHAIADHDCKCVNGEPYLGPDPSIFPVVVEYDPNPPDKETVDDLGNPVSVPQEKGWKIVNDAKALDDLQDEAKVYRESDGVRVEAAIAKEAIEEKNKLAQKGEIVDLDVLKEEIRSEKEGKLEGDLRL